MEENGGNNMKKLLVVMMMAAGIFTSCSQRVDDSEEDDEVISIPAEEVDNSWEAIAQRSFERGEVGMYIVHVKNRLEPSIPDFQLHSELDTVEDYFGIVHELYAQETATNITLVRGAGQVIGQVGLLHVGDVVPGTRNIVVTEIVCYLGQSALEETGVYSTNGGWSSTSWL